MGIFSWFSSKNTEKNSQIRKWVVDEIQKMDATDSDTYTIFVRIIHAAVQCGKSNTNEQQEQLLQAAKQYLGDATIFEIACYTYFRMEAWLAKNQPQLTKEVALPVQKLLVEKFYTALYLDQEYVNRVFTEQFKRYKEMADSGKGIEDFQLELEQRIAMTKGDKFDQKQLPQAASSLTFDFQYIKRSLAEYEEIINSAVITSIEEYCKKNVRQPLQQKQQSQGEVQGQQDYLFGMALVAQQDWVRACKVFTKVIADNPKHYDALVQRGLAYAAQQLAVDAEQDFTKAIAVEPNNATAYLHRATCYHRNFREKDKSLADYKDAIRLAPNNAAGYFGRGELYDDVAVYYEKKALENNEQDKAIYLFEEFSAAIEDYSQVIRLEPEHDAAYANRGVLYAKKARATKDVDCITKAIADFEMAMKLDRTNGYLYKQQDEMQELLEQLSQTEGQA